MDTSLFNEPQLKAIEYDDGPSLVIAGAGSGKTRVLTYKIAHLIEKGYEPWSIMALTFTNKAAKEMRERLDLIERLRKEMNKAARNLEFERAMELRDIIFEMESE